MIIVLILAIIIGMLHAYVAVSKAHNGSGDYVPPSPSLIDFIFFNR